MNWLKGYRTLVVNLLLTALPLLDAAQLTTYLHGDALLWYVVGVTVANIILRLMTTTPVGTKT